MTLEFYYELVDTSFERSWVSKFSSGIWHFSILFSIDILNIDWLKVCVNYEDTSIVLLSISEVGWLKDKMLDIIRSDVMVCLLTALFV